ncbi:MAG: rhodanese-like domain-containing protein [Candidatus Hydrogenedentes bacterium]|nr:rhodanese-like domain-containing protein [Candidatus Hydrogenedentota bacterium]
MVEYRGEYPDVPELTVDELQGRIATENVVLVDVRTDTEQHVSMLPGAITSDLFGKEKYKHKDQTIVTYCTIGYRNGKYAERLRQEGFKVYNLRGSILAWVLAGKPVIDSTGSPT